MQNPSACMPALLYNSYPSKLPIDLIQLHGSMDHWLRTGYQGSLHSPMVGNPAIGPTIPCFWRTAPQPRLIMALL